MNKLVVFLGLLGFALADVRDLRNQGRLLSPFGNQKPFSSNPGPAIKFDQNQEYIAILGQHSNINPDGSYDWSYQTANGISAQEQGSLQPSRDNRQEPSLVVRGEYSYAADDGSIKTLTYVADENGFQPQADFLPTPPPIPPQILRALEWIAAHPERQNKFEKRSQ